MSLPAPQMVKEIQEKTGVPPWLQYVGATLITLYGMYQGSQQLTKNTEAERIAIIHQRITKTDDRVRTMEVKQAEDSVRLEYIGELIKVAAPVTRGIPEPNYDAVRSEAVAAQEAE